MIKLVWDIPTRLFHWLFAMAICGQFITASIGGEAMFWHMRLGYFVLALVLFRIIWGIIGSEPSRFGSFLFPPSHILRYTRHLIQGDPPPMTSHNPLGGLGVLVMLALAGIQASLGLFSNDDIMIEGPLMPLISKDLSDAITGWHSLIAQGLVIMIGLHLLAVVYHQQVLGEHIVEAMIHGKKQITTERAFRFTPAWQAFASIIVTAIIVLAMIYLSDLLGIQSDDEYY